ncbi:MAG: permease-like cell division protein FtsX [Bacteroidota bacterium]
MALVLYFLGLFAAFMVFSNSYAREKQSSLELSVELHDGINSTRLAVLETQLKSREYVQKLRYVSKAEAGKIFMERTGDDVVSLMDGVNPLPASFELTLWPQYVAQDSLEWIKLELNQELLVSKVDFNMEMITLMNRNIQVVSMIFLGIGLVLMVVALYLIFATIRLSIYAQRLTIRSMQLIGATQAFIRRPFLKNGLVQGGIAGLLAGGFLVLTMLIIRRYLASIDLEVQGISSPGFIAILGGIVLLGLALGLAGSYFAVNRYLNRNLDELM